MVGGSEKSGLSGIKGGAAVEEEEEEEKTPSERKVYTGGLLLLLLLFVGLPANWVSSVALIATH